jgi:ERF superfamily
MNRSESIGKIAAALLNAQREMGGAVKGAANPFFRSKFADLNSIREATIPVLNKNGITVLQPTAVLDGRNYVETTLLHESGEFLSSMTEVVCAKQNDPQAHGSGVSYSRRYGLQALLCVAALDDDAEAAMGRSNKTPVLEPIAKAGTGVTVQVTDAPAKRASFRKNTTVATTTSTGDDI